jgi:hypothetical protein
MGGHGQFQAASRRHAGSAAESAAMAGRQNRNGKSEIAVASLPALYKPGMMVVKMIEESYNEPFKTGPLIDQQGHYAICDILMNRTMFDYISAHNTGVVAK